MCHLLFALIVSTLNKYKRLSYPALRKKTNSFPYFVRKN